jgi:hypothetical protein
MRGFVLDDTPLDAASVCTDDPWSGSFLFNASAEKRFFLVCVAPDPNLGGFGLPFDAVNAGLNAYDVAESPGDGTSELYDNALATLYADLDAARVGGVTFKLVEHAVYRDFVISTVALDVTMSSGGAPYLAVRDSSVASHLGLLSVGESTTTTAITDALVGALVGAGLDASGVYVALWSGSLTPDPHGKLTAAFV